MNTATETVPTRQVQLIRERAAHESRIKTIDAELSSTPAAQPYRKKPVVIEAMQWDGRVESAHPIIQWINATESTATWHEETCVGITPYRPDDINSIVTPAHIQIHTLEGVMRADACDWIICGVKGEFYPCKPDIFAATYDAVLPPSAS